jgi:citrate lyase subunit beta/citryl-CoA lyase
MTGEHDTLSLARSWLFVPGDRPERFAKAAASTADVVICDLEDAVAPAAKAEARAQVRSWLEAGGRACVRINAADTAWYEQDIDAIGAASGLLAVMVPKAENADIIGTLSHALPHQVDVIALVETALGVVEINAIASAPRVVRLAFGSLDYALDIDAAHEPEALLLPRVQLVLASRSAGLPGPVDGVTTALQDRTALIADAGRARRLGLTGKLCIHPRQLADVNAAFSPTAADLAWAARVIAAFDGSAAVIDLDGHMVDRPVFDRARRIVALHEIRG